MYCVYPVSLFHGDLLHLSQIFGAYNPVLGHILLHAKTSIFKQIIEPKAIVGKRRYKDMDQDGALSYIVNHVFLPPQLPQEDDSGLGEILLLEECKAALGSYLANLSSGGHWKWAACSAMVSNMLRIRDYSGDLAPDQVEASLRGMTPEGSIAPISPQIISYCFHRHPRLPHPQSECGPAHPQIIRTIHV
jgi:hypothetical protein